MQSESSSVFKKMLSNWFKNNSLEQRWSKIHYKGCECVFGVFGSGLETKESTCLYCEYLGQMDKLLDTVCLLNCFFHGIEKVVVDNPSLPISQ